MQHSIVMCNMETGSDNESYLIVYPIHIKVLKKYVFPECIIVKAGETDIPNVNLHY